MDVDESEILGQQVSTVDIHPSRYDESNLVNSDSLSVMFCWGNTTNGELGLGGIEDQHILSPRENKFTHSTSIRTIACGNTHTLVVTTNGEVYSCGSNDFGQLGHENTRTKFQLVSGLEITRIKYAVCGENHSVVLNEWGQVYSWGSDKYGQLGINSSETKDIRKPRIVKGLATYNVIQIACGYKHCLALTNRGELFSWGSNDYGQLGLGLRVKSVSQPTLVSSLIGLPISFIACGANHSFIISKSGAVYGWGKNKFGQLGLNTEVDYIYPCQLKTLRSIKVKYIVCGEDFSAFLTQDGGVLTCGAGQYGQLGHCSISNEILPRKVLELMGSTVTQVCCGRHHTLAYIPSRDRIYSFGLGGAGQLGTRQLINFNSPQIVMGPWLDKENDSKPIIDKLYSGGDHCFVTLLSSKKGREGSADFRLQAEDTQIWTITPDKMRECEKLTENSIVDQELILYLESVLSSQNCINGSFLLKRDMHYCCTSRHHGLDMSIMQQCFTSISRIRNETIKNIIYDSLVNVLSNLSESPPDVETLRVYLSLPLYHEFNNARHSSKIQGPFAKALLRLKTEAAKIVGNWYYTQSEDYFERLIEIYKNVILILLRSSAMNAQQYFDLNTGEKTIIYALELLSLLNKLNQLKTHSPKVGYDTFHMTELADTIDIRIDYVRWSSECLNSNTNLKFFCNYPFLFDAQAKTLLLQTDQSLQMQQAMTEATQRAIAQIFTSPVPQPVHPFLELHVSRENIIQDTIRELASFSEQEYKKPLKIHFLGEEAEDAGGVKKEFFLLLLREVLDPKYGMFISDPETHAIWFSEECFEDEIMYYLVGLICGLAIYNFTIINLPFPVALYKKLLHERVDLQDLKDLSPSLAKGLQDLLDYAEPDLEDIFCLKFEISRDVYGELRTHELKTGGSTIPVTMDNREEYVDLYVDYILNKGVAKHFSSFHNGFHKVCGGRVLKLFHARELMAVVIGNEDYDWDSFENNAEYRGGYASSDKTIRLFWEVFHELSLENKKKFLTYLTGTDRIPIQGMKAVKIVIQPTLDEKYLPVAHTCFNLLDLPRYSTKSRLKYKLLQAIQQTEGFSIV